MEDEFFEKIKILLENPPEFPYKEAHWKALKLKLKQRDDTAKLNWWKNFWLFFFNRKSVKKK